MAEMNHLDYVTAMGGSVNGVIHTGEDFTTWAVYKYFRILRNYALSRFRWLSDVLEEDELRLIEWHIFHYGRCALVRPKITLKDHHKVYYPNMKPRIFQCNYTRTNHRNGKPYSISIVNNSNSYPELTIDTEYTSEDFTIFTDNFLYFADNTPFRYIALEYANKLYELDLAFNMNSRKMRFPFVFNNADEDGIIHGVKLSEIMRSAYLRNEAFVEIPESMVGKDNFIFEPAHQESLVSELLESQKKLYQAYFEMLGLYTNRDKGGSYTVKRLQEAGDMTGDYITDTQLRTRLLCAEDAAKKFNIDFGIQVMKE